jgi:hypothetical protein
MNRAQTSCGRDCRAEKVAEELDVKSASECEKTWLAGINEIAR